MLNINEKSTCLWHDSILYQIKFQTKQALEIRSAVLSRKCLQVLPFKQLLRHTLDKIPGEIILQRYLPGNDLFDVEAQFLRRFSPTQEFVAFHQKLRKSPVAP